MKYRYEAVAFFKFREHPSSGLGFHSEFRVPNSTFRIPHLSHSELRIPH